MKKNKSKREVDSDEDTMRPEYDFSKGVRGKHAAGFAGQTTLVVLEPDVAAEFRTAADVNETLRAVASILRRRSGRKTA